jgi:ribose transport system permease protein
VLGGTSLGGGKGGGLGSILGALNIYLISYVLSTFNFGNVAGFVTQMSTGAILVASLLVNSFMNRRTS